MTKWPYHFISDKLFKKGQNGNQESFQLRLTDQSFFDPEFTPLDTFCRIVAHLVHHGQVLDGLDSGIDDLANLSDLQQHNRNIFITAFVNDDNEKIN
jgi:hypothetical protein